MVRDEVFLTLFASCLLLHVKTTSQLPTDHQSRMPYVLKLPGQDSGTTWLMPDIPRALPTALADGISFRDFIKNRKVFGQTNSKRDDIHRERKRSYEYALKVALSSQPNIITSLPLSKKIALKVQKLDFKVSRKREKRKQRGSSFNHKEQHGHLSTKLFHRQFLVPTLLKSFQIAISSFKSREVIKVDKSRRFHHDKSLNPYLLKREETGSSRLHKSNIDTSYFNHLLKDMDTIIQISKVRLTTSDPLKLKNISMFAKPTVKQSEETQVTSADTPAVVRGPGDVTKSRRTRDTGLISPYCGPRRRRCFRWVPENECRNMCANNRRYEVCKFRRNGRLQCAWISLDN